MDKPVKLYQVGLALHNFGGEGVLWVDLFRDNGSKPGDIISTSEMISLDKLSIKPGYRWTNFDFRKDSPVLMPGKYWIALGIYGQPHRSTGFYTYRQAGRSRLMALCYKGVFEDEVERCTQL